MFDSVRRTGASVLLQGFAYEASHWEVDHLDVRRWAASPKAHYVRIMPDVITGRRLRLPEIVADGRGYR